LLRLDYFAFVYGGNSFEQKKPDPVGVIKLMTDTGALPRETVMVGDSGKGELYLSAATIGAAATGIGSLYAIDQVGRLGPRLARRSWLGLPRYVWLIGCVGLAFALTNLSLAVAAFTGVAHP